MLIKIQEMMALAEEKSFCVPAFNTYNMETAMGVIAAAEEANAPVIMQIYPRLIKEGSGYYLAPVLLAAAKAAKVPVCFHLDHGPSLLEVTRALRYGATGIMVDGSAFPYEENIAFTRSVVELCANLDISVEAELGHIGTVNDDAMDEFTDPAQAADFAKRTGICCLAVLVGNAHGHYKKPPKLDIDRVAAIREATGLPLVLHGGSGIPDEQVKAAIRCGIRKMNIGTDICCAFADSTLAVLNDPKRSVAVDIFMKPVIEAVKQVALDKLALTGAEGMAK